MKVIPSLRGFLELDVTGDSDSAAATHRGNRRRFRVFAIVFAVVLLPGLTWDFLRSSEYRAAARIQIVPGSSSLRSSPSTGETVEPLPSRTSSDLLAQVQVLTSRPLLETTAATLVARGYAFVSGTDPVEQLKEMINATRVAGTDVVELQAIGSNPELLAAALNALISAYGEQMGLAHKATASEGLQQAREEAASLADTVRARRQQLEAFRGQTGVVSSQRDENEAVVAIKGLTAALNEANERAAMADARLRALQQAVDSGQRGGGPAKDDPTLAGMEQRASQLREEIHDMERTYTPTFMSMDPRARALQARLTELERQVDLQRAAGQEARLAGARENAASARATVERLQAQINAQRGTMQTFSQRFTQAKSLEDDLAQIEKASREAQERLARLEASERSRQPVLTVVEAAATPPSAYRPDKLRDALIVLGGAFSLGLLAMWFVELFNRQAPAKVPASTTVVVPPWPAANGVVGQLAGAAVSTLPPGNPQAAGLLAAQAPAPRELNQTEVAALLAAAEGPARFVTTALLMGLTVDELLALRTGDFDTAVHRLQVFGRAPRTLSTPHWLAADRQQSGGVPEEALLADAGGVPLTAAAVRSLLTCAALDAGIVGATGVTAEALRHTCIAWLVRQGMRFSELASIVGPSTAEELALYADLAPQGPKSTNKAIQPLMPALREAPA